MPKKKDGAVMGRPRKPEDVAARAVKLAGTLGSSEEAARRLTAEGTPVSPRAVRVWVQEAKTVPAVAPPAPRAAGVPDPDEGRPATPPPEVEAPPEGLSARETRLWIVDKEILATRLQLKKARNEGAINTASLQGELRKLLDDRDELSPKEAADPQAEERRWREEASRVRARIEAGVRAFEEG